MDDMSLGSAVEIEEEIDEFTRLKAKRSDDRKKFARSVSQRQVSGASALGEESDGENRMRKLMTLNSRTTETPIETPSSQQQGPK